MYASLWCMMAVVAGRAGANVRSSITVITSDANALTVSESKVTGPDGITRGHCNFVHRGKQIKIEYKEDPKGNIDIARADDQPGNPQELLKKCRQQADTAKKDMAKDLDKNRKALKAHEVEFEEQRKEFEQRQKEFEKDMTDFSKQLEKMWE